MAKWILAYVITLILFPTVKPYFKDIIDSEYVLDVSLGITIFVVVIFLVLLINKGILCNEYNTIMKYRNVYLIIPVDMSECQF